MVSKSCPVHVYLHNIIQTPVYRRGFLIKGNVDLGSLFLIPTLSESLSLSLSLSLPLFVLYLLSPTTHAHQTQNESSTNRPPKVLYQTVAVPTPLCKCTTLVCYATLFYNGPTVCRPAPICYA